MLQTTLYLSADNKRIALWLLICAAVILGMILLGGVTRLTNSGLSMVEWKPLIGVIPPLNQADWQQLFLKYQQFPEYQKINLGMGLDEFKTIFMYEYLHRILGRLIGLIFIVPFLYFYFTRRIAPQLMPKLLMMLALGGCQGLLGWYMVKSGLVDVPHVSQYRLTAHLGLAVFIYGFIVWTILELINPKAPQPLGLGMPACALSALIFLMILSGGLVAGTRAGYAYSTWPLMGDSFVPAGLYAMSPAWLSAFENITTIQFNHRIFAYLIVLLVAGFAFISLKSEVTGKVRTGIYCMLCLLVVQISLGISTLIFYVPVAVAAAHQVGAVALLTATLFVSHSLTNGNSLGNPKYGAH